VFLKGKKRTWLLVALAFGAGLTALSLWVAGVPGGGSDPLFRGRPESEWIKNIRYDVSDTGQAKEWRSYGEDGVQVLIRGLRNADRPRERAYRRFYKLLPGVIARLLPYPKKDSTRGSRILICALVVDLGKDARSAVPVMARSLRDEDTQVRHHALTFFGWPPVGDAVLSLMGEEEKARILPDLIRVTQESGNRINGLSALKYFPGQRETTIPFLLICLQDSDSRVRILAAEALRRVDPSAAKKAGALAIVLGIAKDPADIRAAQAIDALGKFSDEREAAVPALIECLQSTNTSVACSAVWILEWPNDFRKYADTIVPALTKAAQRTDAVAGYAKVALKRYQSDSDARSQ
jgi:HEAT repeat protein